MMAIYRYLAVTLGLALLAGSNGSCSEGGGNANANEQEITVPARGENRDNVIPPGNGNLNLNPGKDSPNVNSVPSTDNSKVTVVDRTKVKPAPLTRPLPENSQLTTVMNEKGQVVETRTFSDHPQIVKVEKVTRGPGDATVRVFLRKGGSKVIDEAAVGNFRTAASAALLKAAGISTGTDGQRKRGSGEEKAGTEGSRGANR